MNDTSSYLCHEVFVKLTYYFANNESRSLWGKSRQRPCEAKFLKKSESAGSVSMLARNNMCVKMTRARLICAFKD